MKIDKPRIDSLPTVEDLPLGGVLCDPGNSVEYDTGGWRTQRPLWSEAKCTNCLLCWINCPDSAIIVVDAKLQGIDEPHCKGCGICAEECPIDGAMTMAKGGFYDDNQGGK